MERITNGHAAYNLDTYEVIICSRGNHLKRKVAQVQRYNKAYNYMPSRWVFAHGKDVFRKLERKILKHR